MRSLFTIIIIALATLCIGCSDKPDTSATSPSQEPQAPTPPKKTQSHFKITDIDHRSATIVFENNRLTIAKVAQPIILIHLFASWSAPSCGMLPYLDSLQKSYGKSLFVVGIMANSDNDTAHLRSFMKIHHASYFISNHPDNDALANTLAHFLKLGDNYPVPVTILFKNGEYTRHYIGATPIEMIRADIEQLRRH